MKKELLIVRKGLHELVDVEELSSGKFPQIYSHLSNCLRKSHSETARTENYSSF